MNDITEAILNWYDEHKRSLPWRDDVSPYRSLISEVMLQQTRVETVKPYFQRFMESFPTVEDLANASQDQVLAHWSGLGYYSRARNLHHAAKQVVEMGTFPSTVPELRKLKGVGEYIAGAIGSIAFGLDVASVDGNHHRVLSRIFCSKGARKDMWVLAESLLPTGRSGDFNQALMDIGSGICVAKIARCERCPISAHCQAFQKDEVSLYPVKKKKKVVPVEEYICLRHIENEQILLGLRPSKGLYGGMMEPPMFLVSDYSIDKGLELLEERLGIAMTNQVIIGKVEHVLTHKKMVVHILETEFENSPTQAHYQKLERKKISECSEVGISSLAEKIIKFQEDKQQQIQFSK